MQELEVIRSLIHSLRLGLRILASLTIGYLLISLLYSLPPGRGLFCVSFYTYFEFVFGLVQALVFVIESHE